MKKKHKYRPGQHSSDPVRAKKFLGQHFLKDESIARQISESIPPENLNNILEIGPGTGMLTKYLIKNDWNLKVIELDRDSIAYLKDDFKKEHLSISSEKFEVIEGDFLQYDIGKLFPGEEFAIIGNFPYNISSQILFKTLENRERIPIFSGMFQKEVAKRICEGPGNKTYGILSVLTQAFYETEYLFTVPPSVFSPPPKVDSGVLRLKRKENYNLECNEKLFFSIVKKGFQQRRKTLRNSLKSFDLSDDLRADPIFDKRPERLSVEDFVQLTDMIGKDRA